MRCSLVDDMVGLMVVPMVISAVGTPEDGVITILDDSVTLDDDSVLGD